MAHSKLLMLTIVAGIGFTNQAAACPAPGKTIPLDAANKAELVFKGRVVSEQRFGLIRTFAVEHTYKGPKRQLWTIVAPLADRWVVGQPRGEDGFTKAAIEEAKTFIIGVSKVQQGKLPGFLYGSYTYDGMVLGGSGNCRLPLFFPYTPRSSTRLELAFGQIGNSTDAETDRLLRKRFGFRVGKFLSKASETRPRGLRKPTIIDARGAIDRQFGGQDYEINPQSVKRFLSEKSRSYLATSGGKILPGYQKLKLAEDRKDLERAIKLFDYNGDGTVKSGELFRAMKRAFSFYDRNNNGVVDDFEKQQK